MNGGNSSCTRNDKHITQLTKIGNTHKKYDFTNYCSILGERSKVKNDSYPKTVVIYAITEICYLVVGLFHNLVWFWYLSLRCYVLWLPCLIWSLDGEKTDHAFSKVMHSIPVRLLSYFEAKMFPLGPILQVDRSIVLFCFFFFNWKFIPFNLVPSPKLPTVK